MENCLAEWVLPEKSIDKPMGAYYNVLAVYRDVAQVGSALRSGRRGRRFESCHLDQQKSHPPIVDGFFVGGNARR